MDDGTPTFYFIRYLARNASALSLRHLLQDTSTGCPGSSGCLLGESITLISACISTHVLQKNV